MPSAELSITLPILIIGLEQDDSTPVVDVRQSQFDGIKDIIKAGNRWRIVNGYLSKAEMATIGPDSELGKQALALAEKLFTTDDPDNEAG
jgi:hypothetical protein